MVATMLAALVAALAPAKALDAPATDGWARFVGGNECQYKLVDEPATWFHAVRHCHEDENGSELALVRSEAEAVFTSTLGEVEGESRWLFGFFDESEWNQDYDALNLWRQGQPGNPNVDAKHCVVQGGDGQGKHLLSAESCSKMRPFVCKICPSDEASKLVVGGRAPAELRQRSRRDLASSTTTTDAPETVSDKVAAATTTTTTGAPETAETEPPFQGGDSARSGVSGVSGRIARPAGSASMESSTLAPGAVAAIVVSTVAVLALVVRRQRKIRAAAFLRNGEGFVDDEVYFSSAIVLTESEEPIGEWDMADLE